MSIELVSSQKYFGYKTDKSSIYWLVEDIINHVQEQQVVKLPLRMFEHNMGRLLKHYDDSDYERCSKADLKYPIIVSKQSLKFKHPIIVDGNHRVVKMFSMFKRKNVDVSAYVIDELPLAYECVGKPFAIPGLNFKWKAKPRKHIPSSRSSALFK